MTKLDLRSQVQGVLPRLQGGTDNEVGAATHWVIAPVFNDSGATIALGSVVTKTSLIRTLHRTSVAGQPIIGVVVGYYPTAGGALVQAAAPTGTMAAVVVEGLVTLLTTASADIGQYLATSTTAGQATPATTKPDGAFGYCVVPISSSACHALIGNVAPSGVPSFATPAVVLGTAAAAGAATTLIRSDATILAFDVTVPVTQAMDDTAAAGSQAVAARRDHKHGMPAFATPAVVLGTAAAMGVAATPIRSDSTIVAFDATVPTTQSFGDTAATGSAAVAARRDHRHGTSAGSEILISDTPSTPLIFADLLQNEAETDLLYGD